MFRELATCGLSCFPVSNGKGDKAAKRPLIEWKGHQTRKAGDLALTAWEKLYPSEWVGVACGPVSGGLEVLDFDIPDKVGGDPPAWKPWVALLKDNGHGDLLQKLVVYRTGSGGRHVAYRCEGLEAGNQKLANRGTKVLIETRGVGGYVVVPPSSGYGFEKGSFDTLPVLTLEERNLLIDAARYLNEPDDAEVEPSSNKGSNATVGGVRPGDDYNDRTSWESILEPLGWKKGHRLGEKTFWTRPGKALRDGHSAIADSHLYVYSTSTDLPSERQLSKFAVYAHLNHKGDFAKAAKQLSKEGFGKRGSVVQEIDGREIPIEYNQTDAGNAARLLSLYGGTIRFCHSWGKWLLWDGQKWSMDEKGGAMVSALALQMAKDMARDAEAEPDEDKRGKLLSYAMKCEAKAKIDNCLALVARDLSVAVSPDQLDSDPWLFACENGVIDLRTGELSPHDPARLITRCSPVKYDPEAAFPQWERFINRVLPDRDLAVFVYKSLGYSMTGKCGEQCFFFLHGSQGANGKSTFMELIQYVLGGYSRAMQPDTLMVSNSPRSGASPDIARLKGARFVSAPETAAGRRLDEQLVKQLTGGDRMVARYLYQDEFEFIPELKLWMTGNHKPSIQGTDNAIWRRVRLIPFSVVIPPDERDPDLKEKLLEEASGILRWMVMGCLDWQDNGLKPPDMVLASTSEYREEMDTLGDFIADRCEVGPNETVQSGHFYECYRAWATAEGLRPWTQKAFSLAMKERGYERVKGMYYNEFRGISCGAPKP